MTRFKIMYNVKAIVIRLLGCFSFLLFLPQAAPANSGIEQIGRLYNYWYTAGDIAISGNFAYVTSGISGLQVVDISDRRIPQMVATIEEDSSYCVGVEIVGTNAFVSWTDLGLCIFDISDPLHPVANEFVDSLSCMDIESDGNFLYARGGSLTMHGATYSILDITNPERPDLIWYLFDDFMMSWLFAPAFRRTELYLLQMTDGGEGGIGGINFTNPDAVEFYWGIPLELPMSADCLTISNDRGYVAAGENGLFVINISDPDNMEQIATIEVPGYCSEVKVIDTLAFATIDSLGDNNQTLQVFDMANDAEWNQIGIIELSDPIRGLELSDNVACGVTEPAGFTLIEISDPENPSLLSNFTNSGNIKDIAIKENVAFLIGEAFGFRAIDLGDPANPSEIATLNLEGDLKYLTIQDNTALVSDYGVGIHLIDISNPADPVEFALIDSLGTVNKTLITNQLLYAACNRFGLRVYDIMEPANPRFLGLVEGMGTATDIAVQDDYAYVCSDQSGLYIVNSADPENMFVVGHFRSRGYARGIEIINENIYLAENRGLAILSIADPERPEEIGYCYLPGSARDVSIRGNYAYVADYHAGLKVVNIEDPTNPHLVGSYQTPGEAQALALTESGLVVIADLTNMGIYDCSETLSAAAEISSPFAPHAFGLSAFPSPFNSSTTISFSLPPGFGEAGLRVYDLQGRLVKDLVRGRFEAGEHKVVWEAGELGSGVYVVRLEGEGKAVSRKIVLMR